MGRPKFYTEDTKVKLHPDGKSRLQSESDRRAVVQFILDAGGVATIGQINAEFKFDISSTVKSLVHNGWLEVIE